MKDGLSDNSVNKNLVGGFYDAGDAIKFNFPASFAMTMLSWSVIEYSAKYEAIGELNHVKEIIKWGTDYLLKTFNNSADTIDKIYAQVIQFFMLLVFNYFSACACVLHVKWLITVNDLKSVHSVLPFKETNRRA